MIDAELLSSLVATALHEDIETGDVTASLIPQNQQVKAMILTREPAIICGQAFAKEAFNQIDANIHLCWNCLEGEQVQANQTLCYIEGPARSILTAERTALNFLQLLSGTATLTHHYVQKINHTPCRLLDTRKTLPGLRRAQKYAVTIGGGINHRVGLFDAFLIKENHIQACGSITQAVHTAKKLYPHLFLEVEIQNLTELKEALNLPLNRIMLDNFDLPSIRQAVLITQGLIPLEVSGNVSLENIASLAETGVDFISVGSLTKHVKAIDLSLRVTSSY